MVHIPAPARRSARRLRRIALAPGLCLAFSCFAFSVPAARANSPARRASNFASASGNILSLAAAVGLPLLSDGSDGRNHALRVADSIGTSVILSEGLKNLFREKRLDSNAHDSMKEWLPVRNGCQCGAYSQHIEGPTPWESGLLCNGIVRQARRL